MKNVEGSSNSYKLRNARSHDKLPPAVSSYLGKAGNTEEAYTVANQ